MLQSQTSQIQNLKQEISQMLEFYNQKPNDTEISRICHSQGQCRLQLSLLRFRKCVLVVLASNRLKK